jgi:hypothetical protein
MKSNGNIRPALTTNGVDAEIARLHERVRKICASKKAAARFLASTGMYSASGRLKPRFRV